MGGSLTNWPATRTKDHQLLLRPVELSSQLQVLPDMGWGERIEMIVSKVINGLKAPVQPAPVPEPEQAEVDMEYANLTVEQKNELLAQARAELTSGSLPVEMQTMVEALAVTRATELVAVEQRKSHISATVANLTGGTQSNPHGLPIPADELVEFMTSLTPDQQAKFEGLAGRIVSSGLVDFAEHGSSRTQTGIAILPAEMAEQLKKWLAVKGATIDEFFKVNAVELGAMADYNLTEFVKEK
jgi:hypothetical protein